MLLANVREITDPSPSRADRGGGFSPAGGFSPGALALSQSLPSTPSSTQGSLRSDVSSTLNFQPDKHGKNKHGLASPSAKPYVPPFFFDDDGQVISRGGPPAPGPYAPPTTADLGRRREANEEERRGFEGKSLKFTEGERAHALTG